MPQPELDSLIAGFSDVAAAGQAKGGVALPHDWSVADWARLFECGDVRRIVAGEALIRRGDPERSLLFVLRGSLEVISHSGHGLSLGALSKVGAGTVLGEVSFFDGLPRSASVWALADSDVAAITFEQFTKFESGHPKLARDLLFALGQVLAARLRSTNAQLDGDS